MAEKMFSLTHLISETKLLGLIAAHADEVRVDIYQPERKTYKPKHQLQNGHASPLMLEAPKKNVRGLRKTSGGMTGSALTLKYLADNKDRAVPNKELLDNIVSHGMNPNAVSVSITGFIRNGYVERTGLGQYKILKEGIEKSAEQVAAKAPEQIDAFDPAPAPKQKQPGAGTGNYDRGNGVNGRALIWAELVKGGPVASEPFRKIYEDNNLSPSSVSSAFEAYKAKGLVKRIDRGIYQITTKGLEKHEQETAKA